MKKRTRPCCRGYQKHAADLAVAKGQKETEIKTGFLKTTQPAALTKEQHGKAIAAKGIAFVEARGGVEAEQKRNALIKQKDDKALARLAADVESHKKQIEALGKEKADALKSAAEKHAS